MPNDANVFATRAAAAGLALLLSGAGCAPGPRGAGMSSVPVPAVADAPGHAGAFSSKADRARLSQLCQERSATASTDGYRIGPDDLLEVRVPDLLDGDGRGVAGATAASGVPGRPAVGASPSFQQGMRVDAGGNVSIPTLGSVRAAGRTANELEQEVARRLVAAGILDAPQVSVLIVEYRSGVAAVVGAVERPGVYPVTSASTSLADLIWLAGGPKSDAGRVVQLTPAGTQPGLAPVGLASAGSAFASTEARGPSVPPSAPSGTRTIAAPAANTTGPPIRMDLDLILHAQGADACDLDPPARAGDVLSVSPAGSAQVTGWVEKPGTVTVTRGLTVTGAIAAAGGQLFPADSIVVVHRTLAPGDERRWAVDLNSVAEGKAVDVPLADGDVVTVPAATSRLVPYGVWTLAREVVHVGGSLPLF